MMMLVLVYSMEVHVPDEEGFGQLRGSAAAPDVLTVWFWPGGVGAVEAVELYPTRVH